MTISLPLNTSPLCLDEDVIKSALGVGMIVLARVNYNWEITDILSAHMGFIEAHTCANSYVKADQNDYSIIAIFPAEDGIADYITENMLDSVERFRCMALGA